MQRGRSSLFERGFSLVELVIVMTVILILMAILVPGVLFCSRPIEKNDPALIDVAPTALRLFGIEPPSYMEGTPLFRCAPPAGGRH